MPLASSRALNIAATFSMGVLACTLWIASETKPPPSSCCPAARSSHACTQTASMRSVRGTRREGQAVKRLPGGLLLESQRATEARGPPAKTVVSKEELGDGLPRRSAAKTGLGARNLREPRFGNSPVESTLLRR